MSIEIGMTGRAECAVTEQNTALAVGSGALPVFATPMMAALMEAAAMNAVSACLEEGQAPWAPSWTSPMTPPHPWA